MTPLPPAKATVSGSLPPDLLQARDVAQWVRSYTEQPQTDEEVGWNDQVAAENWADLPWEE
ncbi:MAG: hypothetical protein ACKVVT_09740 [Dehalococcoidia bacterium]